jgi:peptide chain release factor 1
MIERLDEMERRYEELGRLMAQPDMAADLTALQRYAREHAELRGTVEKYRSLRALEREIAEAKALLEDGDSDDELRTLARETLEDLEPRRDGIVTELEDALSPRDPNDDKNAIVEIRGAAGGEEAKLFAGQLFRMYTLFAEQQGWKGNVLELSETGIGGLEKVTVEFVGRGAYGKLKYESGVHRVQRVPTTESSGRIHTSTAAVVVLPEIEEVDVDIRPEDLRIDVYRSSGHGGQGVNTTDSAVRITHLPTGIVATCQNERSQLQNRASAMAVLRARLYQIEQERRARELGETRQSLVRTGDRSEKIRTYNFPQDRMTDHRIGLSLHNLSGIMDGRIGPVIDALVAHDRSGG